jgi:hypothetical protein
MGGGKREKLGRPRRRPSGYEVDQKKDAGPLEFKDLRNNPLISLDYLAALKRNRRKRM